MQICGTYFGEPAAAAAYMSDRRRPPREERMEDDNAYYCDNDKCQTKVRASKQLLLRQVPSVVTLQLKRFFAPTRTAP